MSSKKEKEEWSEKHAHRIQQRFEQWQKPLGIDSEDYLRYLRKPLGIDSEDYLRYLRKELVGFCENPLKKSLIEMIS
jgi:hypothetical protein